MYSAILLVPADIRSLRKLVMAHLELSGELLASNLVKWYVQHYFHRSIFVIFFLWEANFNWNLHFSFDNHDHELIIY